MKKIHLLAVCLSIMAFSSNASTFKDAGPPQAKKKIVVTEPSIAHFHSFEITALNVDDLVMYSQPIVVVLPYTPEKTKGTKVDVPVYPDTDVGWQTSGPKISNNGICRIRLLSY